MRSVAIVLAVCWSCSAFAGPHRAIQLAREPTPILAGHLLIDLPATTQLAPDTRRANGEISTHAVFDSGAARLDMIAYETGICAGSDLRATIADDVQTQGGNVARARIEPLAVASPLVAFAVQPALPRRRGDPNLVFAAYLEGANGALQIVAFYIDEYGLGEASDWAALARRIAMTAMLGTPVRAIAAPALTLPGHWRLSTCVNAVVHRSWIAMPDRSSCELREDDARFERHDAKEVPGTLLGRATTWSVWTDRDGHHASIETGELELRTLAVLCTGRTAEDLRQLRQVVETLR